MTIKVKDSLKIVSLLLILTLLFILRGNEKSEFLAFFLVLFSFNLLYKVRFDINLIFIAIPIFYANYSIAIGEFLIKNLQVSFNSIRFVDYSYYHDTLLGICIFTIVFTFFIKPINKKRNFEFKDNAFIFYILVILIGLINILFFDRTISESYIVRSNSLHGYSFLLVIFMAYYSGNKKIRRNIITIIISTIALQSLVYGGRQAVIPIAVIFLVTLYPHKLNYKNITLAAVGGVIVLTIIGQLRGTATLDFATILDLFKSDYYVQDTSVYAFNSSVTHVYAKNIYTGLARIKSFFAFLVSIFFGQGTDFTNLGNVTLISDTIQNNLGGGIVSSHFYFWLGWFGVITSPVIIVSIINKLNKSSQELSKLMFIGIVSTTSTWYLYSPLQFFRVSFLLVPVAYYSLRLVDKEIKKMKGYKK